MKGNRKGIKKGIRTKKKGLCKERKGKGMQERRVRTRHERKRGIK